MFSFLKGVFAGAVLAFVVAEIIGHAGGTGGILYVLHFEVNGVRLYWSWPVFVAGTGLGWVIFALLE